MRKLLLVVGLAVCMAGIAGAELFINPGYEDDFSNWENWGMGSNGSGAGDATILEDGTAHSGDKYLETGWDLGGTATSGFNLIFQNLLVVPGDTYTLSAWVRDGDSDPDNPGEGTIPARLSFEHRWWDGVSSGRGDEVLTEPRIHIDFDIPSDGQWHLISATHTCPLTVNQFTAIVVIMVHNQPLDIDDVSLMPDNAHNPDPADGGNAPRNIEALSWENPDPNNPEETITCDVYLAENYPEEGKYEGDPNFTEYAQLIADDQPGTSATILQDLIFGHTYFWRVDCTDSSGTVVGHVWEFTITNAEPTVDAGDEHYTWLTDGSVTVTLDATVTDDGHPDPPADVTYSWAVTAGNAGSVAIGGLPDPADPDTQAVFTAAGTYILQLTADDSELSAADTVTINVYDNACDATKAAGIQLPASDLNQDCAVNLPDLAIIAANWLECMSYDCQ